MNASLASWLVIAAALALANLPFLNESVFGLVPLKSRGQGADAPAGPGVKPIWLRLIELVVLYFIVGLLAWALESRIGNVFAQTWEFYAITGCLFIVLAFPGFVVRYLRKRRH
jgi:hypothetical protein